MKITEYSAGPLYHLLPIPTGITRPVMLELRAHYKNMLMHIRHAELVRLNGTGNCVDSPHQDRLAPCEPSVWNVRQALGLGQLRVFIAPSQRGRWPPATEASTRPMIIRSLVSSYGGCDRFHSAMSLAGLEVVISRAATAWPVACGGLAGTTACSSQRPKQVIAEQRCNTHPEPPLVPWSQFVFVVCAVDNRRLSTAHSLTSEPLPSSMRRLVMPRRRLDSYKSCTRRGDGPASAYFPAWNVNTDPSGKLMASSSAGDGLP